MRLSCFLLFKIFYNDKIDSIFTSFVVRKQKRWNKKEKAFVSLRVYSYSIQSSSYMASNPPTSFYLTKKSIEEETLGLVSVHIQNLRCFFLFGEVQKHLKTKSGKVRGNIILMESLRLFWAVKTRERAYSYSGLKNFCSTLLCTFIQSIAYSSFNSLQVPVFSFSFFFFFFFFFFHLFACY